mmetsp:Transcript_4480/g.11074  ORF Transcript_4480/g.11074 Transcript_4480/m.11074 type:complete len:225 (-) Transcript_4480:714-1388(-)
MQTLLAQEERVRLQGSRVVWLLLEAAQVVYLGSLRSAAPEQKLRVVHEGYRVAHGRADGTHVALVDLLYRLVRAVHLDGAELADEHVVRVPCGLEHALHVVVWVHVDFRRCRRRLHSDRYVATVRRVGHGEDAALVLAVLHKALALLPLYRLHTHGRGSAPRLQRRVRGAQGVHLPRQQQHVELAEREGTQEGRVGGVGVERVLQALDGGLEEVDGDVEAHTEA